MKQLVAKAEELARPKTDRFVKAGGRPRAARCMILGIPNVGKSSLINRLAGAVKAKAVDKPGVTRAKQWIKIGAALDLLDTPGILWPKFEDQTVGLKLAFTGAINVKAGDGANGGNGTGRAAGNGGNGGNEGTVTLTAGGTLVQTGTITRGVGKGGNGGTLTIAGQLGGSGSPTNNGLSQPMACLSTSWTPLRGTSMASSSPNLRNS